MGPAVARTDVFNATAARMSAFNAFSSILSPSWKSIARLVLPSRLELNRPEGTLQRGALGEGHLHDTLVRLARADYSGMRPHWNPLGSTAFPSSPRPLPGVGLLDENSDPSERLAPPIAQLLDSRIYQPRRRVSSISFLRAALRLFHGGCHFLHGRCRLPAAHIRLPGDCLACFVAHLRRLLGRPLTTKSILVAVLVIGPSF